MAQQINISKDNTHGLPDTGTALGSHDTQQPLAVKKTVLRDLQNNNGVTPKILARQPPVTEDMKLSGSKRLTPEFPLNPPCHQAPSNTGIRGNSVYMRRKSEQELVKSNSYNNMGNNTNNPEPRQQSNGKQDVPRQQTQMQEPVKSNSYNSMGNSTNNPEPRLQSNGKQDIPRQQTQMQGPKVSCYSGFATIPVNTSCGGPSVLLSLGKPGNTVSSTDLNHPLPSPGIVPKQHFSERFHKLQMFLKDYDNSSYEEYNKMLRSLSSADRSKHAVELEKRAIHLMLDESKEMQRMKALNILGKASSKINVSPSTTRNHLDNEKPPLIDIQ